MRKQSNPSLLRTKPAKRVKLSTTYSFVISVCLLVLLAFFIVNLLAVSSFSHYQSANSDVSSSLHHQVVDDDKQAIVADSDESDQDEEEPYIDKETLVPVSIQDGQEMIINIFRDAGIPLDPATLESLPSWDDIRRHVGAEPIIFGLDQCTTFRESIKAVERNVACCGMFNSGTNLVTRLLKENCKIPERIDYYGMDPDFDKWGMGPGDAHGMRWQVPWGKHTAARYRDVHSTDKATNISKDSVLPVVTIRHPYNWMLSMCKNGYTAKWQHGRKCPHLIHDLTTMKPVNLTVEYGSHLDAFHSLAHLWNGWYRQYFKDATYPRLIVRFEDLIFHARNVTTQICNCAGGIIRTDRPFKYIVKSAKQGPGHGREEKRTGMVDAWIRYGQPLPLRGTFSRPDYRAARLFLNQELMKLFRYKHPGPKPPYEEN